MDKTYSIKDLERLSGIKAHTIRIWEQRYNLLEAQRTGTNIRFYTNDELRNLLNVAILNRNGLKISHIAAMSRDEIEDSVRNFLDANIDSDSSIDALAVCMIQFDEDQFERIFNKYIIQNGFEAGMKDLIFPFMKKIGVMWMTGTILPAHEHFVSNLVRQKIFVAIDGKSTKITPNSKKILLFLPEQEQHDISILFMNYLFKKEGHEVTYLGAQVPFSDILPVVEAKDPEYIFTVITVNPTGQELIDYIDNICKIFSDKKIVFTGAQFKDLPVKFPSNAIFLSSREEVFSFPGDIANLSKPASYSVN